MKAKEKILKTLKDFGKTATSRIAAIVRTDYNYTIKLLEELEEEGIVIQEKLTYSTYWELKIKKEEK